ncbi:hypothetical protein C2845_PM12G13600 [Panicum miliaceum]|uniref:Uncharacterized protein n=1 Tax=Panicum miliaceum TaxID=4540 RepID=A0A3L6QFV7_PANMI|nr:hypothetical protein C2845_PM12G13600 [Panicum miliaceum]
MRRRERERHPLKASRRALLQAERPEQLRGKRGRLEVLLAAVRRSSAFVGVRSTCRPRPRSALPRPMSVRAAFRAAADCVRRPTASSSCPLAVLLAHGRKDTDARPSSAAGHLPD